jgi:hypothetical protein
MPLVNRGQPKAHDLPEPIASIASHPRSDLIAVVGATTGRIWVVDLDGRAGLRVIHPDGIDRVEAVSLVIGRVAGVLAAQAERPLAVTMLERDEPQTEPNQTQVTPPADASRPHPMPVAPPADTSRPHPMPVVEPGSGRSRSAPVEPSPESPPALARQESGASPAANEFSSSGQHEFSASTHAGVPPLPDTPPAQAIASPHPVSPPVLSTPPRASKAASTLPAPEAKDKRPRPTWPSAEETRAMVSAKASPPIVEVSRPPWARGESSRGVAPSVDPIASWRERMTSPRARTAEPIPALWEDALPMWREEVVAWARTVLASGSHPDSAARPDTSADPVEAPTPTPFGTIITRFELAPQLQPAIALLYGAHLAGHDGVAPADLASILGGRWDEALGRGELAQKAAIEIDGSRVRLAFAITRALDELPPSSGMLVGSPGNVALLGPCVIVAGGPLTIIAEACASSIGGAILTGYSDADPLTLLSEARAYGAVPMLRAGRHNLDTVPTDEPIILVVDDDATADGLGIPRLR